jgi:hypothetical protein
MRNTRSSSVVDLDLVARGGRSSVEDVEATGSRWCASDTENRGHRVDLAQRCPVYSFDVHPKTGGISSNDKGRVTEGELRHHWTSM